MKINLNQFNGRIARLRYILAITSLKGCHRERSVAIQIDSLVKRTEFTIK